MLLHTAKGLVQIFHQLSPQGFSSESAALHKICGFDQIISTAVKNFAQLKKIPTFSMKTKVMEDVDGVHIWPQEHSTL